MSYNCFKIWAIIINVIAYGSFEPSQVQAQSSSHGFQFTHLNVDQGLAQSSVFAIAQDASGFMWFGTRNGLNKYDSRKFTHFQIDTSDNNSISENTVYALCVDHNNKLWVGTTAGLNLFNAQKNNFLRIHSSNSDTFSLSNSIINCIFEDTKHNLWVGTRNGLNRLIHSNPYKFERYFYNEKSPESIREIFEDKLGNIWICSDKGIAKSSIASNGKYSFSNYTLLDPSNKKNIEFNAVFQDITGLLWLGTENNGLKFFDENQKTFVPIPQRLLFISDISDATIRQIKQDKEGNIWMGSLDGLILINHQIQKYFVLQNNPDDASSLSDNSVRSIYMDKNDHVWVGTFFSGINFYSRMNRQFSSFKQLDKNIALGHSVLSAIVESPKENFWIGTAGGGFINFNRTTNKIELFKHNSNDNNTLSNNNVKCILQDKEVGLWLGTLYGLNYYNIKTKRFVNYINNPSDPTSLPHNRIYHLLKSYKGDLWIGTNGGGLAYLKNNELKFKALLANPKDNKSLSNNYVTFILETKSKELWIGTSNGLNRLNVDTSFKQFLCSPNDPQTISGKYIQCLYEDSKGRLWIGSRDYGLSLYLGNNKFKRFNIANGLAGNNIKGIEEDKLGNLWISTDNGILKFNPQNGRTKKYNKEDGLICKDFNINSFYKDANGFIYFGGYNGIVTFHPDHVFENTTIPPLVLTELRLFNKVVKIDDDTKLLSKDFSKTDTVTFLYNQNVFSIEFSVLNFLNSKKNKFAYKLLGFEKDWVYVTEPIATYMNLPSGTYKFCIKGSNNDEIWNERTKIVTIIILPPPWKTWWAYLLYAFAIAMLLLILIRFTSIHAKLEQKLYIEQMESKKQNEVNQLKLRFFTNVSHDLRTPLTLIIAPLDSLANSLSINKEVKHQLQLIQVNANRLLNLFNQLLDFRKQDTGNMKLRAAEGNIIKFTKEIVLAFNEFARIKNIQFEFISEFDELKAWYDREQMEKVIYNLLSNAFKFTANGGSIFVRIEKKQAEVLVISIEDNGIGIAAEHLDKIFSNFYQVENEGITETGFGIGLALCKGIVENHKGTITVESTPKGKEIHGKTKFIIKLPLGNSHLQKSEIVDDYLNSETVGAFISLVEDETAPQAPSMEGISVKANLNKNILIVEDNIEIRGFLKFKLQKKYRIREAENGQEALELAFKFMPDLIISDVLMPIMDGLKMTSILKADERTSHIPIILLTARNSVIHEMEGLKTGADEYLTKPFNVHILEMKINNLFITIQKHQQKYSRHIIMDAKIEETEHPDEKFMQKLYSIIDKKLSDPEFNVNVLVEEIGISRPVLFRKVKAITGLSVIELLTSTRLKRAAVLLQQKQLNVSEVAYAVGFSYSTYFSNSFRKEYGMSPSEYITQFDL